MITERMQTSASRSRSTMSASEPEICAKSTDISLRSPSSGSGALVGAAYALSTGEAAAPSRLPQLVQKCAVGRLLAPQLAHAMAKRAPHRAQKPACSGFTVEQDGHNMKSLAPYGLPIMAFIALHLGKRE